MEMKVIAKHIVKPSRPTPDRFKYHKLSILDQFAPSTYIPFIFFYENDRQSEVQQQHDEISISRRLKESLSEILTVFYPLAGTIQENSIVDCDDTGAEFVEARVHGRRLAPIIRNPNMEELEQLVPAAGASHNDNILLSVKTSYFDCGGIAVGVCLSHKIGDMASLAMFTNAWAASSGEEGSRMIQPSFDLAVRFPPTDKQYSYSYPITREKKTMTKRLVFERNKMEKLRAATSSDEVKNPSRVEAVSAFIWRNFIAAGKSKPSSLPFWSAMHLVNMRPRAVPPMPDHSTFGNCVAPAIAVISSAESGTGPLVSKLRAAIRAVDGDYIDNFVKVFENLTTEDPAAELLRFSSWCRFPVYDVDFGWGKPVWVATTPMPLMNFIILMTTPSEDGIEAWFYLNHDDDHLFQLLQASFNDL